MGKELDSDIQEMEKEFEVATLNKRINELEAELEKAYRIIQENDLEDELDEVNFTSVEEQICIDGIRHLAKLFEQGSFTKDDTQMLDILHKNLRMIRGQSIPNERKGKKVKKEDLGKLFDIVKGTNE